MRSALLASLLTLTAEMIALTGLDHESIYVNPAEIVSIREPRQQNRALAPAANCVVSTTDGKFVSVREDCQTVRSLINGAKP